MIIYTCTCTYDEKGCKNVASTHPETMLITGWNFYTNVRKFQLPELGNDKKYRLTPYDHPTPQSRDESSHLLESTTCEKTTVELDNYNYDVGLEQITKETKCHNNNKPCQ